MMSQKPGGTPTNRQKMVSGIIFIVIIIIVWQVIGMFSGKKSTTFTPVPNHTSTATPTPTMKTTVVTQPQASVQSPVNAAPVSKDIEFLRAQREIQQKYIDSLNELQMLRIKKEIAETNQAIATAKLATVTAEKNISDVMIQPVPLSPAGSSANPAPMLSQVHSQYVVISVAMQHAKWTAILGYQGKLYNISVGDVLPPDGSMVVKIGRDGVLLERNGEKIKISMVSEI